MVYAILRAMDSPSPIGSRGRSWLVLALITLLYIGVSFAPVIFDDNEGLYAGAVREMHARGDWLVPMSNGFPRVQKPPLVYWTMLVSTSVLGEDEFALRLPNALATAGWIAATYLIMRRIGGERFGVAAAAALASMLGVWVFTHLVQPEPFLACFISFSFWCLIEARFAADRAPRWLSFFWVFLALGTMSKGLHGALWPLGSAGLLALFVPGTRGWLRTIIQWRGMMLFLVITVPWYAFMAAKFPQFLSAHFLNEQVGAALNSRYPADARQLSLAQFYGQHLLFWLPWTLVLPGVIYGLVRMRKNSSSAFESPESDSIRLIICWVMLTLVSVAFSTRQDYYSLTCWGAVAAFLVSPWTMRQTEILRMSRAFLIVPALLIAFAGAAALSFAAMWHPSQASTDGAATPIAQRDTFMDALSGISPALWGTLIALLAVFGAALLLGGAVAAVLSWRRLNYAALLVIAATMAVPILLATRGFVVLSPYFSLADEARAINTEMENQPGALVACEALPNTASSLLYYLNARVHWVNAPFNNQYAQEVLGEGREYYLNPAELENEWRSSQPVYLIIEGDRLAYWKAQLFPVARMVKHSGTRYVLCNR